MTDPFDRFDCDRCRKWFPKTDIRWIRHPDFCEIVCRACKERHEKHVAEAEKDCK